MNFFGFQFIIGNSSVTATKKFQNILSSSVIAGGIYGEHLSQNRRIDRIFGHKMKHVYVEKIRIEFKKVFILVKLIILTFSDC